MIGYPKWIEDAAKLDKYYENVSRGKGGVSTVHVDCKHNTIFSPEVLTKKGFGPQLYTYFKETS